MPVLRWALARRIAVRKASQVRARGHQKEHKKHRIRHGVPVVMKSPKSVLMKLSWIEKRGDSKLHWTVSYSKIELKGPFRLNTWICIWGYQTQAFWEKERVSILWHAVNSQAELEHIPQKNLWTGIVLCRMPYWTDAARSHWISKTANNWILSK